MRPRYPHTCTITRTTDTISATGGVATDGAAVTIYDGKCDAQENSRRFNIASGIVASRGSATVFLPFGTVLEAPVAAGDAITVTWEDTTTRAGTVDSSDNLESSLLMLYD